MQTHVPPGQPYPPQQKKSGSNGCLIALAVVGGVVVICGIVAAVFLYTLATSKEGRALISMAGEGADIAKESLTAPGTKELQNLGCQTPSVLDMERMSRLASQFLDAGSGNALKLPFRVMVTCQVDAPGNASLTCDDVARTYVTAVGRAPGHFAVHVTQQGGENKPNCRKLYSADGAPLGDLHDAGVGTPVGAPKE